MTLIIIAPCSFCHRRPATEYHHMFSNTEVNRKIYGRKLINEPFNKRPSCNHCNGSHANVETWDEKRFRQEAIEAGYKLPRAGKSYKGDI